MLTANSPAGLELVPEPGTADAPKGKSPTASPRANVKRTREFE